MFFHSRTIKQIGGRLAPCSPISRRGARGVVHAVVRVQLKFADAPSGILERKDRKRYSRAGGAGAPGNFTIDPGEYTPP